ncbi:glycosyltransferase family 4 protein [Flavilitoribacter nigricans]|uniref:Glycosyl transferase family 1 n=1 Tax=Flavilitoribacter nigricans (strain ATCC 23147 / DSM 23189 / NBRC 102662 / NCIMB 1420 / SS-2) TaxID=1122177 RepID=A0A2D0N011_FLAN2|nr:glycosyltransferase family 4 protein [Flavilitoribacter nigricans]PHN01770.1 glycosyl transferase family 1 [Flavilitoribacter nigricans DSM 23189 = NBRC 102662]
MKILVISSYDEIWNAVRPEGELFIGLHHLGEDVTIMTEGHSPYADRFRSEGLKVIDFHPKHKFKREESAFIREQLLAGNYDILHLFNNKAIINGIRAAKGLPVKVVTYRGYTGNVHWYDPSAYLTHLNPRVDAITCVSEAVRESFEGQLFFDQSKAMLVHKGHDPAWYADIQPASLAEFDLPPEAIVVSMVANARKMKGLPYLLQAARQLSLDLPVYFLLIGRGMDTPEVRRELEQSPYGDRFRFAGFRKDDVLELVKACDISILPSIRGEGLSKVILEAMFLGKPVIMTNIGGNKGLAEPGKSGYVVPPGDAAALADALTELATDEGLRRRMGEAAKKHIAEHFGLEKSVRRQLEVYRKLLN